MQCLNKHVLVPSTTSHVPKLLPLTSAHLPHVAALVKDVDRELSKESCALHADAFSVSLAKMTHSLVKNSLTTQDMRVSADKQESCSTCTCLSMQVTVTGFAVIIIINMIVALEWIDW